MLCLVVQRGSRLIENQHGRIAKTWSFYDLPYDQAIVPMPPEEAAEQVRITMLHEAGHFFGLDEAELERVLRSAADECDAIVSSGGPERRADSAASRIAAPLRRAAFRWR